MLQKPNKAFLFLPLLACCLAFAFLLQLAVFPFLVFTICAGFFLLCWENEFLGFCALAFFLPLNLRLKEILGTEFALIQDFLLLALAIEFFSRRAFVNALAMEKNRLLLPFGALFFLYILSAVLAVPSLNFPAGIPLKQHAIFDTPFTLLRALLSAGEWLLVFFLSLNIIKNRDEAKKALSFVLVALFLVSALAVLQHNLDAVRANKPDFSAISAERFFSFNSLSSSRVSSLLPGPNPIGWYAVLLLPIAVSFAIAEKKKLKKAFFAILAILSLLAVFYSCSRTALFGVASEIFFLIALLATAVFFRKKKQLFKAAAFAAIMVLLFSVSIVAANGSALFGRGTALAQDTSLKNHVLLLQAAGRMIMQNPLFGIGPGLFFYRFCEFAAGEMPTAYLHSHNLFLEIAAEAGLPALVVFLLILAIIFSALYKRAGEKEKEGALLASGIAIGFAGFLACGLFDYVFFEPGLALLFWCIAAISFKL